jgi:hypothetical protein
VPAEKEVSDMAWIFAKNQTITLIQAHLSNAVDITVTSIPYGLRIQPEQTQLLLAALTAFSIGVKVDIKHRRDANEGIGRISWIKIKPR